MRGKIRKAKLKELHKDFKHLRKEFEKSITKLNLDLETELSVFVSLDNMQKILDKLNEMCYNK